MERDRRAPRSTRQRAAVVEGLRRAGGFRTAQELHEELRSSGVSVGLTTVYRTLQLLVDGGEVDVLSRADGESIYRRCASGEHHHHLVCTSCGHSVEIDAAEVEAWSARVAHGHGFTSVTHVAELFGLCRRCGPATG